MDEQKNGVPEQAEQPNSEMMTEAQEQQTAAEQENQSMEQVQNTPEQIDYKSELEKANLRIAELEKKSIMHNLLVKPDDYDEILPKAMKLVDEETSLEEAFSLLAAKYPEKIRLRPCIDMGGTTKGTDFGDDSFTSAFRGNLPNSYPSTANANTVKDRSGFFEKR